MAPSEIRQLLASQGIRLTKSLGQNFLHDSAQLGRIVEAAGVSDSDKVLEIGPGLGPLTQRLAARARLVLAIEKDARLLPLLQNRPGLWATFLEASDFAPAILERAGVLLLHDDALHFLRRERMDWRDWKLVSNLPYSVASQLLVELALSAHGPKLMVATLQLEVAKRLMAKPNTHDYGLLTLLIQLHYVVQRWFKIPAGCFFPEPDVDSACVCLARRETSLLSAGREGAFVRVVKSAFSQRRKIMFKLLKHDWPEDALAQAVDAANIPRQARAETVSLEQFAGLVNALPADSRHEPGGNI